MAIGMHSGSRQYILWPLSDLMHRMRAFGTPKKRITSVVSIITLGFFFTFHYGLTRRFFIKLPSSVLGRFSARLPLPRPPAQLPWYCRICPGVTREILLQAPLYWSSSVVQYHSASALPCSSVIYGDVQGQKPPCLQTLVRPRRSSHCRMKLGSRPL